MLVLTFRYDKLQIGSFQTATLLEKELGLCCNFREGVGR